MKKSIFGLILAFSSAAFSLPDDARRAEAEKEAREIVMKMTVKERLTQLWMSSCEIPRLGIRHREWWNEALHGVARAGLATVFPQSIGAAATQNLNCVCLKSLLLRVALSAIFSRRLDIRTAI